MGEMVGETSGQGVGAAEGEGNTEGAAPAEGAAAGSPGKVHRRLSESLSDEQQRALGMITQGVAIREVGQQLGIHRGTVYRWLKTDPYFRAAYNAWQLEQQESCRAALVKAAESAVKRVIEAMRFDQKLAWQVIKELGILSSRRGTLALDPARVRMEIEVEQEEEESSLQRRRMEHQPEPDVDPAGPRLDLLHLLKLTGGAGIKPPQSPGG